VKNEDASRYARSKPPVFVWSVAATGCIILTVVVFNSPLNAQKDSADVDRRELARREQTNESQKNEAVEAIERELSKINAQLRANVSDDDRSKLTQLRGRMLRRLSDMEENERDPERLRQQLRDELETINRLERNSDGSPEFTRRRDNIQRQLEARYRTENERNNQRVRERTEYNRAPRAGRDNQDNEPPRAELATRMSRLLAGIKELKSALNRQGISPKAREEFERRRVEIKNEAERLHQELAEHRAPQENRERRPVQNDRLIKEIEFQKRALHASIQDLEHALASNEFSPEQRRDFERKRRDIQDADERLHRQSTHEHEHDPPHGENHDHDGHDHADHREDGDPHGGIERRIRELQARVQELGALLERREFHPEKREELMRERRELQGEIERLRDEYAQLHEHESRNAEEREHQEREHSHDRERELQEQEVHLRHLEIDIRQLEMQAAHREAAAQSAQLADNKLASLSMAIQRASEFLGENEAREFLNDLLEQTRDPQVARLLRHELVRLSFQVEDHDAVRHHLRSLILERD